MSHLRLVGFLFVCLSAASVFAQVTPVTQPGTCAIRGVSADEWFDGTWWHQSGSVSFSCAGQFPGSVSASVWLEGPNSGASGLYYSTGTYGTARRSWPFVQQTCYAADPYGTGGAQYCTSTIIPIPSTATLGTPSVAVLNNVFRAVAKISWDSGSYSCTPYGCFPIQTSVTASTPWQGPATY